MDWTEVLAAVLGLGFLLALVAGTATGIRSLLAAVNVHVHRAFATVGAVVLLGGLVMLFLSNFLLLGGPPKSSPPDAVIKRPPDGFVGMTVPNEIFEYRPIATAPASCKDPNKLLEQLKTAIDASAQNSASGCSANIRPQEVGFAKEVSITCVLSKQPDCTDVYTARVWAERDPAALGAYVVRGFGWIQRACARGTYDASASRTIEGTSETLKKVFDACR